MVLSPVTVIFVGLVLIVVMLVIMNLWKSAMLRGVHTDDAQTTIIDAFSFGTGVIIFAMTFVGTRAVSASRCLPFSGEWPINPLPYFEDDYIYAAIMAMLCASPFLSIILPITLFAFIILVLMFSGMVGRFLRMVGRFLRSDDGGESADKAALRALYNSTNGDSADKAALRALYNSTNGDSWENNTNWGSDRPLGEWHGVDTDGQGRVTDMELDDNNLTGEIPPELGNLHNLGDLWLNANNLTGEIPPELGNLANLTNLDLRDNSRLTGEIPRELVNRRDSGKLEYLLSGTNLTEPPPEDDPPDPSNPDGDSDHPLGF